MKELLAMILASGALLFVATARAQLTLSSAVDEALGKSPEILRATADEHTADWQKVSRLSGVLPRVTLFADHYFNAQYETVPLTLNDLSLSIPLPYPKTAYGVEASWTIFDGFANWDKLDAAELGKRAARTTEWRTACRPSPMFFESKCREPKLRPKSSARPTTSRFNVNICEKRWA